MRDPSILRDFLVALTLTSAVAIVTARLMVWWIDRIPTPPGEPPFKAMVWEVLAEARQITYDAAAGQDGC